MSFIIITQLQLTIGKSSSPTEFFMTKPEQLHIAYGNSYDSMTIAWQCSNCSLNNSNNNSGNYGSPLLKYQLLNSTNTWNIVNSTNIKSIVLNEYNYIKFVTTIYNLQPNEKYVYIVTWINNNNSNNNDNRDTVIPSATSYFTSQHLNNDTNWSPKIAFFGDLGYTDNQIKQYISEESISNSIDLIILYGDMIYWPSSNGINQNLFMNDLCGMANNGNIPIHVSPGNGDSGNNFTIYKNNFFMPQYQLYNSLWHSINIGKSHIIGISTEAFYYQSKIVQNNMINWLINDLTYANTMYNRTLRPWIIVHYHRPTYSTWGNYPIQLRESCAPWIFEEIMYEYNVDIVLNGHIHNQERMLPVYNGTIMINGNKSESENPNDKIYYNMKAPIYIVSGNPGNAEEIDGFFNGGIDNINNTYSAFRSYNYGYGHLTIVNETTVYYDLISSQLNGKVIDFEYFTKTNVCNYGKYCKIKNTVSINKQVKQGTRGKHGKQVKEVKQVEKTRQILINNDSVQYVPSAQVNGLINLYNVTNGTNWRRNDNWLIGDPCINNWFGVSCHNKTDNLLKLEYRNISYVYGITVIQLASNNLLGNINDINLVSFCNTLQILDFGSNLLYGTIHKSFYNLHLLHTLILEPKYTQTLKYRILGSLPDNLGDTLYNLRYLYLQFNQFNGSLPSTINKFACFTDFASLSETACHFIIMHNNFSGIIPPTISNVTFGEFYGAYNNFACPYPTINAGYTSMDKCP